MFTKEVQFLVTPRNVSLYIEVFHLKKQLCSSLTVTLPADERNSANFFCRSAEKGLIHNLTDKKIKKSWKTTILKVKLK